MRALVLITALIAGLMSADLVPDSTPLRIMVVGDSITHGKTGDDPWRCHLYRAVAAVRPVDMVGVRGGLYGGGAYADPSCDPDHAAQWGQLLEVAGDTIRADVATARPDVLLVLIGVNDVNWRHDLATIGADLRAFLAGARSARPGLTVVIGTVLPTAGIVDQAAISAYNRWLWSNADALGVTLATTAAAIDPQADLYDGVHPNDRGAARIAAAFLATVPGMASDRDRL